MTHSSVTPRLRCIAVLAAASALCAGAAMAQDTNVSSVESSRKAYSYALKCYYADIRLVELFEHQGDKAKASIYEESAKRSYDGAIKLGRNAGFTPQQVSTDLTAENSPEPQRMLSDPDYFERTANVCKALGLM